MRGLAHASVGWFTSDRDGGVASSGAADAASPEAPDHQGRGLATQLLHRLIDHARSTGAEWLWLEVRPSNARARRLYAHLGFEQVGVRKGYYPDGRGQREDALVLRLSLKPGVAA